MLVRFLEGRPNREVAAGAECVDVDRFAQHQFRSSRAVNGVALRASHGLLGMTGRDAAEARVVVQMATKAGTIRIRHRQLGGLPYVLGFGTFSMLGARPMTGFAGHGRPAPRAVR